MGVITKKERQLIDEAIAAGKVQKIKRWVSSFPGYAYDEKEGKLKSVDPDFYKKNSDWGRKKLNQKVEARRMDVLAMYKDGKTYEQMTSKHNVALHTIQGDMRVLRSRGHTIDMQQRAETVEHDKRCDIAMKAAKDGCSSIAEVCRVTGLSPKALTRSFRKAGRMDEYRQLSSATYRKKTKNAEPRRMKVKELHADGVHRKKIAEIVGTSVSVVAKDLQWLREHGHR